MSTLRLAFTGNHLITDVFYQETPAVLYDSDYPEIFLPLEVIDSCHWDTKEKVLTIALMEEIFIRTVTWGRKGSGEHLSLGIEVSLYLPFPEEREEEEISHLRKFLKSYHIPLYLSDREKRK